MDAPLLRPGRQPSHGRVQVVDGRRVRRLARRRPSRARALARRHRLQGQARRRGAAARRRGRARARRCSWRATRPSHGTRPPCRRRCPPEPGRWRTGRRLPPSTRHSAGRSRPTASPATAAARRRSRGSRCRPMRRSSARCRDRRGHLARARPRQHAGQRSRPGRAGGGGGRGGRPLRRQPAASIVGEELLDAELPGDPRGRAGQRARAAAGRPHLGRSGGAQGDAGRQGRLLRHGRARHQAVLEHAADEEGHGRRRADAGAGAVRHGAGPAGAAAPADPGGREQHRRLGVPAGRRADHAQRHDGRDHQHRRRGAAGPGRRAGRGRRARSRSSCSTRRR